MHIRAAERTELRQIGDIRVAAYRADGFLSAATEYETVLRELGADGGQVLVAADDLGALVGTVMLQHWPDAEQVVTGPDEAEIRALAVLPEARGNGLGKALVAAVIDCAVRENVHHLVLCTQPEMTTAHRLYAGAGFVRLPERDWTPVPGVRLLAYGLAVGKLVQ